MENSVAEILQPSCAHRSGHIGEDPFGIPNDLMPFVQQVAVSRRPTLIFLEVTIQ